MQFKYEPSNFLAIRNDLGYTQAQLAGELGCTLDSVRNYEHGRSHPNGYVVDSVYRMWNQKNHSLPPPLFSKP